MPPRSLVLATDTRILQILERQEKVVELVPEQMGVGALCSSWLIPSPGPEQCFRVCPESESPNHCIPVFDGRPSALPSAALWHSRVYCLSGTHWLWVGLQDSMTASSSTEALHGGLDPAADCPTSIVFPQGPEQTAESLQCPEKLVTLPETTALLRSCS